jgi:hypothetical protein
MLSPSVNKQKEVVVDMRTSTYCPNCYRRNEVGVQQCVFCGALMPSEQYRGSTTSHVGLPLLEGSAPSPCSSTSIALPRGGIGLFVLGQNDPILLEPATSYVLGRRVDPYTPSEAVEITELFSPPDSSYFTSFIDLSLYKAAEMGVSRHHVRIFYENKGFYVEDLSSTNGTWLNQMRLPPNHPQPLQSNDRLLLGQMVMWVCLDDQVFEPLSKKFYLSETAVLTNDTPSKLVFEVLAGLVMPYLAALIKVQHMLDRCGQRQLREIYFLSLATNQIAASSRNTLITIEAVGLDEALYAVKERVSVWRNLHISLVGQQAKNLDSTTNQELARLATIILTDHNPTLSIGEKFPLVEQLVPFLGLLVTTKLELST